jgi:acetyltransferase-like isoleucine patch superfamily enzyme
MFRRLIDRAYSASRGMEAGLDSRLGTGELIVFITERSLWAMRGIALHRRVVFRAPGVRVRGRRNLRLGQRVVLGRGVTLSAVGVSGIELGDRCTIDSDALLRVSGVYRNLGDGIQIGANSAVGARNVILGQGGVSIGANVLIGPGVSIVSENHVTANRDTPIRDQGERRAKVVIHDDVWIGAGAIILAGSVVGRGAVVAAGAVVRGAVADYAIVAGVPARKVSER